MATQELNVKFKVDASDVTSGSKEAKDKVKDAASQMAQDVKSSSQKMEQSFKDVAKSTDSIKDATKTATTAVKTMETQVDASAKNMEKSMDSVSKKMSAMQAFHMGARGVQMIGGLAQNIASSYGADETASNIKTVTNVATGATQGAATGFAVAGPIGAAAGGLLGAANSLMTAGKELQDAAKSQDDKARSDLEAARQNLVHQNDVEKWTKEAKTLANAAYGNLTQTQTGEGRDILAKQIEEQRRKVEELTKRRDEILRSNNEKNSANIVDQNARKTESATPEQKQPNVSVDLKPVADAIGRTTEKQPETSYDPKLRAVEQALASATDKLNNLSYTYDNSAALDINEGKVALDNAIAEQTKRIESLTQQRDDLVRNYDENGDVFAQAEKMRALNDAIAYATEKLNIFTQAAQEAADADAKATAAEEAGVKAAEEAIEARKQEAIAIRKRQEEADAKTAAATEKQRNSITAMFEQFDRQIQKTSAKNNPASLDSAFESLKTVVDNIQNLRNAFNNGESVDPEVLKKNFTDFNFYKDIIDSAAKEGQVTLADLQSELNGQMRSSASGPSDALTKIGGGVGYTSYNNSVEGVQKTISDDLKTLIKNQTSYNANIETKLQQLIDKPTGSAVWEE